MPVRFIVRTSGSGIVLRALSDLQSRAAASPNQMVRATVDIAEQETDKKLREISGTSTMFNKEVYQRERRRGKWTKAQFSGGGQLKYAIIDMDYDTHPMLKYYVEGTEPHIIRARFGKALSFVWQKLGGKRVFFTKVNHPGTRPHPIASDIRSATRGRVDKDLINWFRGRG